jgi:hypothetical protein
LASPKWPPKANCWRPSRRSEYFEIGARSILNRTKPNMPFQWTINPYRGCEFGCQYCYARYTHEFMGMEDGRDFESKIYAKAAAPEILRRELRKLDRADRIAIGTATDPYQPAERRFGARARSWKSSRKRRAATCPSPPSRTWWRATWICCAKSAAATCCPSTSPSPRSTAAWRA